MRGLCNLLMVAITAIILQWLAMAYIWPLDKEMGIVTIVMIYVLAMVILYRLDKREEERMFYEDEMEERIGKMEFTNCGVCGKRISYDDNIDDWTYVTIGDREVFVCPDCKEDYE